MVDFYRVSEGEDMERVRMENIHYGPLSEFFFFVATISYWDSKLFNGIFNLFKDNIKNYMRDMRA